MLFSFCLVFKFSFRFFSYLSRQIHRIDLLVTKLLSLQQVKLTIVCVKWKGPYFVFSYYHRSDDRQVSLISRNVPNAILARLARLPVVNARMNHNQEAQN